MFKIFLTALVCVLLSASNICIAATSAAELNKQTQNPIAALISLPLQNNWTFRQGPESKTQYVLNIQPVIPISINNNWNLITRIVLPVVSQPNMGGGIDGAFGLSDTDITFFLSPVRSKIIWGIGPVITLPTSTKNSLGSNRWGMGPSIVLLTQQDPWTIGLLANQVWSVCGGARLNIRDHSQPYSNTLIQSFISYSFWEVWNIAFVSETTCNWESPSGYRWTVPLDLVVSKIVTLGSQAISIGAGGRFFPITPARQSAWGARFVISFLFPR